MDFASVRLATEDVDLMVRFYEAVTGLTLDRLTDDFAELRTPSCTLAIAHTRTLAIFGGAIARAAANHTAIIEFRVDDVDADYARLQGVVAEFVQTPTTMPWGNRSMLFRDPDGNLLNYFTPVSPAAIARFAR